MDTPTTDKDNSLNDVDIDNVQFTKLPPQFFPEYWKDDTRMAVLMAPFRQRAVNPINYDNKMQIWINLILKYCEYKGCAGVSLAELQLAFRRANKKPYALEKVLDQLKDTKKLQTAESYMEPPQHTWRGWATQHMSKAMTWPLLAIKARIWQKTDSTQESLVLLDAVKVNNESSMLFLISFVLKFCLFIAYTNRSKLISCSRIVRLTKS